MPIGLIRGALERGTPARALRTLARIVVHTSGNADGVQILTAKLADRVGVSRRTVQRDVRALEQISEVRVERTRVFDAAEGHPLNWPNRYHTPQVPPDMAGVIVWADLLASAAWAGATAAHQGLLLYLIDVLGPKGRALSAAQMAEGTKLSLSCVRAGVYYWRKQGVLEVTPQKDEEGDGSRLSNWLRVRDPREHVSVTAPPPEDRRSRALAPVVRWSGLHLAELDRREGGWWGRVMLAVELEEESPERRAVESELGRHLNGEARKEGYRGSGRRRDIRAALPTVAARRAVFDAELLEAEAEAVQVVSAPERGEPWSGDWVPEGQSERAPVTALPVERWSAVVGILGAAERQVQMVEVRDGRVVLVVESPSLGSCIAEQVERLASALGAPLALRLRESQRAIDAKRAREQVRAHAPRLERDEARLREMEAQIGALPPLPPVRLGDPLRARRQERWDARAVARDRIRDLLGEQLLDKARWAPGGAGLEPAWESVQGRLQSWATDMAAVEQAVDSAVRLGGM